MFLGLGVYTAPPHIHPPALILTYRSLCPSVEGQVISSSPSWPYPFMLALILVHLIFLWQYNPPGVSSHGDLLVPSVGGGEEWGMQISVSSILKLSLTLKDLLCFTDSFSPMTHFPCAYMLLVWSMATALHCTGGLCQGRLTSAFDWTCRGN